MQYRPIYAYATLYVLMKGKRVTLAIRGVRWLDTSVAIITYLLAELDALLLAFLRQAVDKIYQVVEGIYLQSG